MNPTEPDAGALPPAPRLYAATAPRTSPPTWAQPAPGAKPKTFPTGAKPTPPHVLRAAPKATLAGEAVDNFAVVPERLDYWGNERYGDCVTAEEAFAKACYSPEIFIPADVVIAWARAHGVLNGATLDEVLSAFISDGFKIGSQQYNDGAAGTVDYTSETQLKLALTKGPVKIAIDHSALPPGAGNEMGWWKTGGRPNQFRNTDHCVSLCGFGSADYLYGQLGVPLPKGLAATTQGYMLFTWSTLGFVDHAWLLSTCVEAWLRQPTTVGVPPLPGPGPGPGPGPEPGPGNLTLTGTVDFFGHALPVTLSGSLAGERAAGAGAINPWVILADLAACISAARAHDWDALAADVEKLLADLGLMVSPETREKILRAFGHTDGS